MVGRRFPEFDAELLAENGGGGSRGGCHLDVTENRRGRQVGERDRKHGAVGVGPDSHVARRSGRAGPTGGIRLLEEFRGGEVGMIAEKPRDGPPGCMEVVGVERCGLATLPESGLHLRWLTAGVDPLGAAPATVGVNRARDRVGRGPLGFQPATEFLGQVVGQSVDLDARG